MLLRGQTALDQDTSVINSRQQSHQQAIAVVGQQVEQTVRALADIAYAAQLVFKHAFLANHLLTIKHQSHEQFEL